MTANKRSWSIKYEVRIKLFLGIQGPRVFMSHASFLRRPLKRWASLKRGSKLRERRWDRRHRRLRHKTQMKGIPDRWGPGPPLQPRGRLVATGAGWRGALSGVTAKQQPWDVNEGWRHGSQRDALTRGDVDEPDGAVGRVHVLPPCSSGPKRVYSQVLGVHFHVYLEPKVRRKWILRLANASLLDLFQEFSNELYCVGS